MVSDEEFINRFRERGDRAALGELLKRHLPQVRRLVFQITLNDGAADDLAQEVWLRVVRGLAGFDGRSKFSTWLYRIAKNVACTWLERESRRASNATPELLEAVEATATAPDQRLLTLELTTEVEAALAKLAPSLRTALVLTALHGVAPAEVAAIEECTVSTIYWRVHTAREQLRKALQEHLP